MPDRLKPLVLLAAFLMLGGCKVVEKGSSPCSDEVLTELATRYTEMHDSSIFDDGFKAGLKEGTKISDQNTFKRGWEIGYSAGRKEKP